MTQYQLDIIFALRDRHDKGRPKPPLTAHGLAGCRGSAKHAAKALNELCRQGLVVDVGLERPLYQLTAKGFTFTN
jgi:hypothetical protein